MAISGMSNRRRITIISALLAVMYVIITVLFITQLWRLPGSIEKQALAYQNNIEKKIDNALSGDIDSLTKLLDDLKEEYPLEAVIEYKGEVIYKTLNLDTRGGYVGVLDDKAILVETSGNFYQGDKKYHIWYSIYEPSFNYHLQQFSKTQLFLNLISFIIMSAVIFIIQRLLVLPLTEIKDAVEKLKKYDFDVELSPEDDIRVELSNFAHKLDEDITKIEYEQTKIGTELQQKEVDLSNILMISQGMIHELKTPLYQALHKAEAELKNPSLSTEDQIKSNISNLDQMLQSINGILMTLKNPEDIFTTVENINLSELVIEEIKRQQPALIQKDLALEIGLEENIFFKTNSVCIKMLIQNVLLNAVQYALPSTEISVELYKEEDIIFKCSNTSTTDNITRMKDSGRLLNVVGSENKYSSGTGLFIIKQLSEILEADYTMETVGDEVVVTVVFKGDNYE